MRSLEHQIGLREPKTRNRFCATTPNRKVTKREFDKMKRKRSTKPIAVCLFAGVAKGMRSLEHEIGLRKLKTQNRFCESFAKQHLTAKPENANLTKLKRKRSTKPIALCLLSGVAKGMRSLEHEICFRKPKTRNRFCGATQTAKCENANLTKLNENAQRNQLRFASRRNAFTGPRNRFA